MRREKKNNDPESLLQWAKTYKPPEVPGISDDCDIAFRQQKEVFAALLVGEITEEAAMNALCIRTDKTFERDLGQAVLFFLQNHLISIARTPAFKSVDWKTL